MKLISKFNDLFLFVKRLLLNYSILRRSLIILWHIAGCVITYLIAFLLRFDWILSSSDFNAFLYTVPFLCVSFVIVFAIFKMHSGIWSYVSFDDLPKILMASITTILSFFFLVAIFLKGYLPNIPRSVLVL